MSQLDRIKTLAGLSDTDAVVAELKSSQTIINEAHNAAIRQAKAGKRIDESLFATLITALSVAGQASVAGTKAIASRAASFVESLKQLYTDGAARAELKELVNQTEALAEGFEILESEAPTVLKRDKELATSVGAFKAAMQDFIGKLTVRGAAIQASESKVNVTEVNVAQLFEEFYAPMGRSNWVRDNMADINFEQHRDIISHALAAKLSPADLRRLKDEITAAKRDEVASKAKAK